MVKTGNQVIEVPSHSRVRMIGEDELFVWTLDEAGEPKDLFATGRQVEFRTREDDVVLSVHTIGAAHWSYDAVSVQVFDPVDPIPHELIENERPPETLQEKLQRMAGAMVMNMFGRDSKEVETFEESLDFDINEDGEIGLSGFEVVEMDDIEPTSSGASEEPAVQGEAPKENQPVEKQSDGTPVGAESPVDNPT